MIDSFKEKHLNNIRHALLTSRAWEVKGDSLPIYQIKEILIELGCVIDEDSFDNNGWQYDWWLSFNFQEVDFTISGSGYYGGLSLYLKEI